MTTFVDEAISLPENWLSYLVAQDDDSLPHREQARRQN